MHIFGQFCSIEHSEMLTWKILSIALFNWSIPKVWWETTVNVSDNANMGSRGAIHRVFLKIFLKKLLEVFLELLLEISAGFMQEFLRRLLDAFKFFFSKYLFRNSYWNSSRSWFWRFSSSIYNVIPWKNYSRCFSGIFSQILPQIVPRHYSRNSSTKFTIDSSRGFTRDFIKSFSIYSPFTSVL